MQPSLSDRAAYASVALTGQCPWMVRRKQRVELIEPALFRHHLSFDFEVPEDAPLVNHGQSLVPLTLLEKNPGSYFRFDFRDAHGTALSLPTREENGTLSAAVLLDKARDILGQDLTDDIAIELRFIAHAPTSSARRVILDEWMRPSKRRRPGARIRRRKPTTEGWRGRLTADPDVWWLIRVLATSSIVMIPVHADPGERVLIKLAYDEEVPDFSRGYGLSPFSYLAALSLRTGYRSFPASFFVPWATAGSFHFEVHAPPGLSVVHAALTNSPTPPTNPRHIHLYQSQPKAQRVIVPNVRFRLDGSSLGYTATLAAAAIAATMWLLWHFSRDLSGKGVAASVSALLLVPGFIATYLSRPQHPITARMVGLSRILLVVAATMTLAAAGRLAVISTDHPATTVQLRRYFWVLLIIAIGTTALLALNRVLDALAPLTIAMRARWRRWRRERDVTKAAT